MDATPLDDLARRPLAGDNVAIAVRELPAGTVVQMDQGEVTLSTAVPEAHRFAVEGIAIGDELRSWGLPFGVATRPISAGDYVANPRMLEVLRERRRADASLPVEANFENRILEFGQQRRHGIGRSADALPPVAVHRDGFLGFDRGSRGVGTRNYLVVIGLTSRVAGFARAVAAAASELSAASIGAGLDGVVPIAHTEGAGRARPHNRAYLLRTLAGVATHANVAGALVVDDGHGVISMADLRRELQDRRPTENLELDWFTAGPDIAAEVPRAAAIVAGWASAAARVGRSRFPLSALNIALQCGGSDAFSGVSGNPLAAAGARAVVEAGGSAILAETDELIGAEPYIMERVRSAAVGERFLAFVEQYKQFAARHGYSAEHNPSGGNFLRGLYNITLKSLGAAMKLDPALQVEAAIDYAEPVPRPGFHFMNSPGNDLESVAGQLAGGANVIYFVTGNGSVTNFPIVPTVKIVTTTGRYTLLPAEMDVNAGAYLDGTPMAELTDDLVARTCRVASGDRSAGERAGHSQVQIWRDWRIGADGSEEPAPASLGRQDLDARDGQPLSGWPHLPAGAGQPDSAALRYDALRGRSGTHTDQVALIMPTSLCAGQVAQLVAADLNRRSDDSRGADRGRATAQGSGRSRGRGVTRYVALPHTEGCGCSSGPSLAMLDRTILGYVTHPTVAAALLLEHGCEHTHNDHFRTFLQQSGVDVAELGWASVQIDGGIAKAGARIAEWLDAAPGPRAIEPAPDCRLQGVTVGMLSDGKPEGAAPQALADAAAGLLAAGAGVVVTDGLAAELAPALAARLEADAALLSEPTLAYGQRPQAAGLHVMETVSPNVGETLTGLGATGAELLLAAVPYPVQGHPMLPVVQATWRSDAAPGCDAVIDGYGGAGQLLELLMETASRRYRPAADRIGNVDFQISRGATGVSM